MNSGHVDWRTYKIIICKKYDILPSSNFIIVNKNLALLISITNEESLFNLE